MEREFGLQVAKVVGQRLKRTYEIEQTDLPERIARELEKLHAAEAGSAPQQQECAETRDLT